MRTDLEGKIEAALLPLLGGRADHICIIDPPGHANVGDSVILLGELDFIAKHVPRARLSFYDVDNYSAGADAFIEQASVILIHGGGNFGDIWPRHHELRMRILGRFPHKPTIQLPQSIHFASQEMLKQTAATIAAHTDFTLMVRDRRSLAFAAEHFDCPALLSPDMAFAMRPIIRKPATVNYFCLLRTDKESAIDPDAVVRTLRRRNVSVQARDWLDEPATVLTRLDRGLGWRTRARPRMFAHARSMMMRLRRHHARQRLRYGIDLLSRGSAVVTDRLHAHILCCLLDIPHCVFDSFDGKISAFHAAWTMGYPEARLISSPDEIAASI